MLSEYLDVAMKRQDQFKSPLVRVQRADGSWGLERAYAGMAITQPEEEINQGNRLLGLIDYAETQDPTGEESTFLKTKRTGIQALIDSGIEITQEMGDIEYDNISGTFKFEKPTKKVSSTYWRIDPDDPTKQILTKSFLGETREVTEKKPPLKTRVEELQNLNYKNQTEINTLEAKPKVGYEEPKEAQIEERKYWFDKKIPAEEGEYWEMVGGEKLSISEAEYTKRSKAETVGEKRIAELRNNIKARNARIENLGGTIKTQKEIPAEIIPETEEEIKENERERLKKFITK